MASSSRSTSRSWTARRAACTRSRCCCAGAGRSMDWCCRTISFRSLEENGMIVPVGEWVIRRACEQSMAWQRAGPGAGAAGDQPVGAPVHAPRAGGLDQAHRRRNRHRPGAGGIRNHRDRADAARRADARDPRPDQPHGHAPVDRRFRHRLFEPGLPEALPGPEDQDRPRLHPRTRSEQRRPGDRRRRDGAGEQPAAAGGGGRRRDRSAAGAAARLWLPVRAGLAVCARARCRGGAGLAGGRRPECR
jgi:hypothetical protein